MIRKGFNLYICLNLTPRVIYIKKGYNIITYYTNYYIALYILNEIIYVFKLFT